MTTIVILLYVHNISNICMKKRILRNWINTFIILESIVLYKVIMNRNFYNSKDLSMLRQLMQFLFLQNSFWLSLGSDECSNLHLRVCKWLNSWTWEVEYRKNKNKAKVKSCKRLRWAQCHQRIKIIPFWLKNLRIYI